MEINSNEIVEIKNSQDFEKMALKVYDFQLKNNPVYNQFIKFIGKSEQSIQSIYEIPFLPVEFFKSHKVLSTEEKPDSVVFTSSGTTGSITSSHYVNDIGLYEKSFKTCFLKQYGNISNYCVLALLPSYLDRSGSSLVYMANSFINESNHPCSGFYKDNYTQLISTIHQLKKQHQPTLLLGVTYALLDLADMNCELSDNFIVMETGGMKGKRREMLREELHNTLKQKFKINHVHSEYGMTELLSQAYSKADGVFECPPWMKIFIREMNDPFQYARKGNTGGINVIDLANLHSCSFIATKDIGKLNHENNFEILGRFDNSDIRGCNLMIQ